MCLCSCPFVSAEELSISTKGVIKDSLWPESDYHLCFLGNIMGSIFAIDLFSEIGVKMMQTDHSLFLKKKKTKNFLIETKENY